MDDGVSSSSRVGHTLYFYDDITRNSVMTLIVLLNEANELATSRGEGHIDLHIHSHGGDFLAAMAMASHVSRSLHPVHTFVDGWCAGAAVLLFLAGVVRRVSSDASIRITSQLHVCDGHVEARSGGAPETLMWGNLKQALVRKASLSSRTVQKVMRTRDVIWRARDCLRLGVAHAIWDVTDAAHP